MGIYANAVDHDDFDGKCSCTTKDDQYAAFRVLKTIAGASRENQKDVSCYECVAPGEFPIILN